MVPGLRLTAIDFRYDSKTCSIVCGLLMRYSASKLGKCLGPFFEGAMILVPDVLGRQFDIEHGCADLRVPHEAQQGSHGHAGTDHVGAESVAEPMRAGTEDMRSAPMVTKQRAQASSCHRLSASSALQRAKKRGGVRVGPFELGDARR